jgi:hypothetical protein
LKIDIKSLLKKVKSFNIEIKLPHLTEQTARELILLAGFLMMFVGICGYDWRIALILGGWMLMKFSGLIKRVIV